MSPYLIGLLILAAAGVGLFPLARAIQRREEREAMRSFRTQREGLEARFFDMASALGKPRGLRWKNCDWQPSTTFARERETRLLTAFVSVEVSFTAIEGGEMEDVAAVSTVRDASAVFHYQNGQWGTGGKALFNMNPTDAVTRLEGQFLPVT